MRRLVVNAEGLVEKAQGLPEFFVWETLHPNEHTAGPIARVPLIHVWCKASPTAQIEVADAEVRT